MNIDNPSENSFREDIAPSIYQVLDAVSLLLSELDGLREKYRPTGSISQSSLYDTKAHGLPVTSQDQRVLNPISFRHRRGSNRRKFSIVSVKWAWRDASRFEEKVKKLKSLIDGLDNISRVASTLTLPQAQLPETSAPNHNENPPRYSALGLQLPPYSNSLQAHVRRTAVTSMNREQDVSDELKQYLVMKEYLISLPELGPDSVRARDRLVRLSKAQFEDLRADVYDELVRRQEFGLNQCSFLLPNPIYHSKRNEARQRLSGLLDTRFNVLIADLVSETDRRLPHLCRDSQNFEDVASVADSDLFDTPRELDIRRWGYVGPNTPINGSYPSLTSSAIRQHYDNLRALYRLRENYIVSGSTRDNRSIINEGSTLSLSTIAETVPPNGVSTSEIFKSLRVSKDDTTAKVLPVALKKYNINALPEAYSLNLAFTNGERCLDLDEKPLLLFKKLEKEGLRPMFMLRKLSSDHLPLERVRMDQIPGGIF